MTRFRRLAVNRRRSEIRLGREVTDSAGREHIALLNGMAMQMIHALVGRKSLTLLCELKRKV